MGQCLASDTSAEDVKVPKRKKQPNGASNMKNSHYTAEDLTRNQPKPPGEQSGKSSKADEKNPTGKRERKPSLIEEKKERLPTLEERKEQSLKLKNEGNAFFKVKNYRSAIKCYTKAVEIFDQDSTYYSNRAMCYRFEKDWKNAVSDSESSINFDPTNYKGYFLKAICLVEFGKQSADQALIGVAIDCFSQALSIYQKKTGIQSDATTEDIEFKLQKAKKIEWLMTKESNLSAMDGIQSYLHDLVSRDNIGEAQQKKEAIDMINHCRQEREKEYLNNDIPDFYTCKISFELMKNPVVTPEGFAYEKANIKKHLTKNGPTDPLSRNELHSGQLIDNHALKQAIDGFRTHNPWAFDFLQPNERFEDVIIS